MKLQFSSVVKVAFHIQMDRLWWPAESVTTITERVKNLWRFKRFLILKYYARNIYVVDTQATWFQ